MNTKICKICKLEKDLSEFRNSLCKKNNKIYYRGQCKNCEKITNAKRAKHYYLLNKKKANEANKKYREFHKNDERYKNRIKEYGKKYRELNKSIISEKRKQKYKDNIDKEKEYKKRYYYSHQEERKIKDKIYYKKNKEKILDYQKKKRQNDNEYRFKKQIRTMIWNSFNRNGHTKKQKGEEILGCNIDYFYSYLLQTFKDNYGYDWDKVEPVHIDHIKPISLATNEKETIKLCHYTNLQLLKADDNYKKSNKLNWNLPTQVKGGII